MGLCPSACWAGGGPGSREACTGRGGALSYLSVCLCGNSGPAGLAAGGGVWGVGVSLLSLVRKARWHSVTSALFILPLWLFVSLGLSTTWSQNSRTQHRRSSCSRPEDRKPSEVISRVLAWLHAVHACA